MRLARSRHISWKAPFEYGGPVAAVAPAAVRCESRCHTVDAPGLEDVMPLKSR